MFSSIESFLLKIFTDMQSTFVWIFAIGIAIAGLGVWIGGEENNSKFKKALWGCCIGLVVFLIAKPAVEYFRANL